MSDLTTPAAPTVHVTAASMLTCHGDTEQTWSALKDGLCGVQPLTEVPADAVNVDHWYPIDETVFPRGDLRPSRLLALVLQDVARRAAVDPIRDRVTVVVGSALREQRTLEVHHAEHTLRAGDDHSFPAMVREALPGVQDVLTVVNACAASGYGLAIAQDLLTGDEADVVIVAGVDTLTASMMSMIGLVGTDRTERVEPFDRDRKGPLLGEGAAAVVLQRDVPDAPRLLGVGLGCDAYSETAPLLEGVADTIRAAHEAAGVDAGDVNLIIAHGTGTNLNDPTEAQAIIDVFGRDRGVLVTALKGSIGHTSGSAALINFIVAMMALREGVVPGIVGLANPIPEAEGLTLPTATTAHAARRAQVHAFGFGGVNAVAVLEVAA